MIYTKIAENEKEAVDFPVICHLVARALYKVAAPYFFLLSEIALEKINYLIHNKQFEKCCGK